MRNLGDDGSRYGFVFVQVAGCSVVTLVDVVKRGLSLQAPITLRTPGLKATACRVSNPHRFDKRFDVSRPPFVEVRDRVNRKAHIRSRVYKPGRGGRYSAPSPGKHKVLVQRVDNPLSVCDKPLAYRSGQHATTHERLDFLDELLQVFGGFSGTFAV